LYHFYLHGLLGPGTPLRKYYGQQLRSVFRITRLREWNQEPPKASEAPPESIHNVTIQNVIAHVQGGSLIGGHPESWLDGISLENVKLFLSTAPLPHSN